MSGASDGDGQRSTMFENPDDDAMWDLLRRVRTIAVVGASPRPDRDSARVAEFLIAQGYDVIPVNPGYAGEQLQGRTCVATLADVGRPIDMVDVFRRIDAVEGVAQEAIAVGAKVLWLQLELWHPAAAKAAQDAGLEVVMDRCPAIEIPRLARSRAG